MHIDIAHETLKDVYPNKIFTRQLANSQPRVGVETITHDWNMDKPSRLIQLIEPLSFL